MVHPIFNLLQLTVGQPTTGGHRQRISRGTVGSVHQGAGKRNGGHLTMRPQLQTARRGCSTVTSGAMGGNDGFDVRRIPHGAQVANFSTIQFRLHVVIASGQNDRPPQNQCAPQRLRGAFGLHKSHHQINCWACYPPPKSGASPTHNRSMRPRVAWLKIPLVAPRTA